MKEWEDIVKFNDIHFPDWKCREEIYLSNAIAGEAGEICNKIKKRAGGGTNRPKEITNKEVAFEAVDVFVYLVLLFEQLGYSRREFSKIFAEKLKILYKRMEKNKE